MTKLDLEMHIYIPYESVFLDSNEPEPNAENRCKNKDKLTSISVEIHKK